MKVKAAAKINLMLDILKKLDNGYHSLFMIMQSVDLYDTVSVEKNCGDEIIIKCDADGVPCNEKNIAYKCAVAFFDALSIADRGITIEIEKAIPMAAGTAGGSADGAAVIYCLDKLYNTKLSTKKLCEIGAKVGADIPFSLVGGTAIALGTGTIIAPVFWAIDTVPNLKSNKNTSFVLLRVPSGNRPTAPSRFNTSRAAALALSSWIDLSTGIHPARRKNHANLPSKYSFLAI